MVSMTDTYESIALAEVTRSIDQQERHLESLRTRASAVLSVAAVVFGLLVGKKAPTRDWMGITAIAIFTLIAAVTIWTLWPRTFVFRYSAFPTLQDAADKPTQTAQDIAALHYKWAYYREEDYQSNKRTLGRLLSAYQLALVLLALETVILAIRLGR